MIRNLNSCCNPDCDGESKMRRCGGCRRARTFYCASCDVEVRRHYKIYCDDCAIFSRTRYNTEAQKGYRENNRDWINTKARENRARKKQLNKSLIIT